MLPGDQARFAQKTRNSVSHLVAHRQLILAAAGAGGAAASRSS
jgi:hypothetical protein